MGFGSIILALKHDFWYGTGTKEGENRPNPHHTPQLVAFVKTENGNSQSSRKIHGQITSLSSSGKQSHARKIALLADSKLSHPLKDTHLTSAELVTRFDENIQSLTKAQSNSSAYGIALREAEEILSILETHATLSLGEKLTLMKAQLQTAYAQLPAGSGTLMKLEVDYLKRKDLIPQDVVCKNHKGETFNKPPISIAELESLFFSIGYPYVMHSREATLFEGIEEVCDVIMVGGYQESYMSWTHWKSVAYNLSTVHSIEGFVPAFTVNNLESEVAKIDSYFSNRGVTEHLGYASVRSFLIDQLRDRETAKKLIQQGFQICTVLIYPKTTSNFQKEAL